MAALFLDSTNGEPIEDFALRTAEAWGGGQAGQDQGLLLVFAIGDRRSRIEVGYGLEPVISDALARRILAQARPLLRAKDFDGALTLTVSTLVQTFENSQWLKDNALGTDASPAGVAPVGTVSTSWLGSISEKNGLGYFLMIVFLYPLGALLDAGIRRRRSRGTPVYMLVLIGGVVGLILQKDDPGGSLGGMVPMIFAAGVGVHGALVRIRNRARLASQAPQAPQVPDPRHPRHPRPPRRASA